MTFRFRRVWVAWWRNWVGVGLVTKRSRVRFPLGALLRNNCRQVVYTQCLDVDSLCYCMASLNSRVPLPFTFGNETRAPIPKLPSSAQLGDAPAIPQSYIRGRPTM